MIARNAAPNYQLLIYSDRVYQTVTKMSWRMPCRLAIAASLASVVSLLPTVAQAQNRSLPSREQIELPKTSLQPPFSQVQISDETRGPVSCPFAAEGLSASIETIVFADPAGNQLPAEITQLLEGIEPTGDYAPLTQLCDLRDEAAAKLFAAGYIAAVTIPPQEITRDARTAKLTVIPARLVGIETVGDPGPHVSRIAARADRLQAIYPLRTADLERELLIASDNPGLDLKMSLRSAGTAPGEIIGLLQVSHRSYQVLLNAQNYGSTNIGREIGSLRAEIYGLTGLADVTFIGASSTADFDEQWTVQGGHYFTLDNGLTAGGSVTYAETRPDLGALDLRSKSLLAAIELYAPIVRTVSARGTLGGGLEIIDQENNLFGNGVKVPLTRDELRVAFLELQGNRRWLRADGSEALSFDGTLELRKGLSIFGASQRGTADGLYFPSSLEGDPTALIVRGGYSTRASGGNFALLTRLEGQYSSRPLLGFEEYSVGNYTIGRGYDPSVTSGDSAVAVRVQPSLFLRRGVGVIEPYAFGDVVRIWNEDSFTTEDGRTLASAGLGARLYLANRFVLDAGWAHPFDKPLNLTGVDRAPDRFLVSFTSSFGPTAR